MSTEPRHRDNDSQDPPAAAVYAEPAMSAARTPVGTGTTPLLAELIALALVGVGVVAIRDALVAAGAVDGTSWTQSAIDSLDDIEAATWVLPVSALVVLVGLALLVSVLKPRPRKAIPLKSETGVFLRTHDLARVARDVVQDVDGVTQVKASATRRSLSLTATTITRRDQNPATQASIRDRLEATLTALEKPPKAKVKIRNEGYDA